jgi:hemerythrin
MAELQLNMDTRELGSRRRGGRSRRGANRRSLSAIFGALLTWNDHFSVGDAELDDQHQNFVRCLNDLHALRLEGTDPDDVKAAIREVELLLMRHFSHEEDKLVRCGYPYVLQHAAEHRTLMREFETVRANVFNLAGWGSKPDVAWPVLEFMIRLTVGHMLKSDMEYRDYLRAHGLLGRK